MNLDRIKAMTQLLEKFSKENKESFKNLLDKAIETGDYRQVIAEIHKSDSGNLKEALTSAASYSAFHRAKQICENCQRQEDCQRCLVYRILKALGV